MECRNCGGEMYREERVDDTAKADISVEKVYVCEECREEWNPDENELLRDF